MRSGYTPKGEIVHILAALEPHNRLACEISLATGLRINDVLALKTGQVKNRRFTVKEQKTGKTKVVYLPKDLQDRCISGAGQHFVFEHRLNGRQHRTRQAVFKDLKKAAGAFGVKANISPHSLRKIYAVEQFERYGDLQRIKRLLNHSNEAVTMIYAMADILEKKKNFTKIRKV